MSYAVQVMVIDRNTRKGLSGQKVKTYGGCEIKTDSKGMATVVSTSSLATVYVNGRQVYSGGVSSAPNPIIHTKG